MRILLGSHPDLFHEGIKRLLEDIGNNTEFVLARSGAEAIELATCAAPDLFILDFDSLKEDPVITVRELRERFVDKPVVALSWSEERPGIEKVLQAGASGYIPKSSSAPVLLAAIKLVLAGGTYLPSLLLNSAMASDEAGDFARAPSFPSKEGLLRKEPTLTPRQFEVLALVAKGESNKVIARRLGIADSTVKIHMHAIFQALEVKSRSQAAIVASRLNKVLNEQIQAALQGETSIAQLLPSINKRRFKRGELLFRKGDRSNDLYYISSGEVHLEEIDSDVEAGTLMGEIGLFAPNNERTCTASCKTDAELFVIPAEKALQIYCQDAEFALFVTHLIAERLVADKVRLESA